MTDSTPAIERLQKKLEKDPNSLAFVQLADEYRKAGIHDEALQVCREGLRKHPKYWSAYVTLGRIQYEMNDTVSAAESLERVVAAIPDNLMANRLLGDIYLQQGKSSEALKRYKVVQMLTPADQEVRASIKRLESQAEAPLPSAPKYLEEEAAPKISSAASETFPELQSETTHDLEETLEKTQPEFRLPEFSTPEVEPEETFRVEPDPNSASDTFRLEEDITVPEISIPETDLTPTLVEAPREEFSFAEPTLTDADAQHSEADQLAEIASIFLEDQKKEDPYPVLSPYEEPESVLDLTEMEDDSDELEQVLEEGSGQVHRDTTQPIDGEEQDDTPVDVDELTTETLAELYVQQGSPERAIRVYQKLLLNDPGNTRIQQRLAELNPVEALIASASAAHQNDDTEPQDMVPATVSAYEHTAASLKTPEQKSQERLRKISTLESWLATIRRER